MRHIAYRRRLSGRCLGFNGTGSCSNIAYKVRTGYAWFRGICLLSGTPTLNGSWSG